MNCQIDLTREDYTKCLNFILKLRYLWNGAIGDFRSSGIKRDIGKYIHDHMGGKLGEIAVQKLLQREFGVNIEVDFQKYEGKEDYEKADIIAVERKGQWIKPSIKVEIKDTKPSSRWVLIPVNLSTSDLCDYFIFVSVDMPLDQLILYFRESLPMKDNSDLQKVIKDFSDIKATVFGILSKLELQRRMVKFNAKDSLPEVEFFEPRAKIPVGLDKKEAGIIKISIPKLGDYAFHSKGQYFIHSGKASRKFKGKIKTEECSYIEIAGKDVVLTNEFFGRYLLQKGIYKIAYNYLSPLREDNYGIPIRNISCNEKDWHDFISVLLSN